MRTTNADDFPAALVVGPLPAQCPAGATVFNAPRPLTGHAEWTGNFFAGTFYAAVIPGADYAAEMKSGDRDLGAIVLRFVDNHDVRALLRHTYCKMGLDAQEIDEIMDEADDDVCRQALAHATQHKTTSEIDRLLADALERTVQAC